MGESDVAFLSIGELGALLRTGALSPVELTRFCLDRLETVGRSLNAVSAVLHDVALREASLAEAELKAGLDRGPLHGIPYGLKDIIAYPGAPTTWGAEPFRDQVFTHEATIARKLRDAGAILVAKLATVEIAGGMGYDHPNASITGATSNPWNPRKWTSGSSSGPAAAVSGGLVPFAIGSDTGGSILFPAAVTGTAGLRATYGRVSRFGVMNLCWTLDRLGPICRRAEDCGLVLEAIAGHDPRDPASLKQTYRYSRPQRRTSGFRIGVIEGSTEGASEAATRNFSESLKALQTIGTLEDVALPDFPYGEVTHIVTACEAYAAFDEFIAAGRTQELTAAKAHGFRLAAAVLPAHDYIRAQRIRRLIAARFGELAARFDVLVAPSVGAVASDVDAVFEYGLASVSGRRPLNLAGVLSGTPTISILNGFGEGDLPTGIQLAGPALGENGILDAAVALEETLGLAALRPPGMSDAAVAASANRVVSAP